VSIEEEAKAEAKRLMAEVNKLQARFNTQTAANKLETDKLIAEINKLQVDALKERDAGKARHVLDETRRLFEEQLAHIEDKQKNMREQINRLVLAKQKYDVAQAKPGNEAQKQQDAQVQQQLAQLIKRKKEEYLQMSKEAELIRQRAKQKSIQLAEAKPVAPVDDAGIAKAQAARTEQLASTAERAKNEAEKLIKEARRPKLGDTTEKAEEVSKLIAEISKLQSAAEQGALTEDETKQLEDRLHKVESKQREARDQINQLTQAKIKYELALTRAAQEKDQEKRRRLEDEKLQGELNDLIKSKEDEQRRLMAEVEQIRLRSEQESSMLKTQRDAARALAERQADDAKLKIEPGHPGFAKKSNPLLLGGSIAAAIMVVGGGIIFLTPLGDKLLGKKSEPATVPSAPAPSAAPPEKAPEPEPVKPAQALSPIRAYRDSLSGGEQGPIMVQLPAGEFMMGSKGHLPYPDEHPQFKVSLQSFSISKYEITFKEYQDFAKYSGRKPPDDQGWGRANRPVINVTWQDAVAYTQWLTSQTGHQYRLPSEREWEFAATAGTGMPFWWGDKLEPNRGNCGVCGSQWDGKMTAPVGSFNTNPFGLNDMLGNVMEWTVTCYHGSYEGAPAAGQIWEGGDCSKRIVRGSAFDTYQNGLRLSKRSSYSPGSRSNTLGFRVARVD
jgi:formylglycine-generating enzyme required for sulfatase activity